MANIRISKLSVKNSTTIEVMFTADLDTVGIENVSILGVGAGIPDLEILSVSVLREVLSISVRPMRPRAQYKLVMTSTDNQTIRGINGQRFLEDGATNQVYFLGQREDNDVRENILEALAPIYDTEGGLLVDTIDTGASSIVRTSRAAGEVRSANYVSIEVVDESITRGSGPFDRFGNEGVFQLLRVGSTTTSAQLTAGEISFDEFPTNPVSLQQVQVDDEIISNSSNNANSFVGLLITFANKRIIKLLSLTLVRDSQEYTYNIDQFRYGLLESKYDDNAYSALDIENNQVRLSTVAVGSNFPLPQGNDQITVSYLYKRVGRDVDVDTVEVNTIVDVVRESVPSVAISFFLNHAPVVDNNGNTASSGGVTWLDPEVNFDPDTKHPAFVTEIPFDLGSLPSSQGQFAVNYSTGQVLAFGEDGSGADGTTTVPPVATYKYLKSFQEGLDYTFFPDLDEIVSLPDRDLRGNSAIISFNYEDTFANNTDFIFSSHVEVINERVQNRLIENIGLRTSYSPVNEVFRIYNETTGEIYTPTRIYQNEVYFSAVNPPVLINIERESADFDQVIQSQIVVTDELTITGKSFVAFRIELSDAEIMAESGDFLGANFNTSLTFSDEDVFVDEMFYDQGDTLNDNLIGLSQIGDYMVDYVLGLAYVAVSSGSSTSIGDATYRRAKIKTRNTHIIRVDDVYKSTSVLLPNTEVINVETVEDQLITVDLDVVGESTIDSDPILVVDGTPNNITVSNDINKLRAVYQVTDLQTQSAPINFAENATVVSATPNKINLSALGATVNDTGLTIQQAGSRKYVVANRISSLHSAGLAQLVSAVSVTNQNVNYFSQGADGYVDASENRIYLPTSSSVSVGQSVGSTYKAKLNGGAAVLVDYSIGNIFVDYTYSRDELLISYEYGDNVLDWSISSTLEEGEEYFVTYRYGALRSSLRDNFGVLTSIEELSNIPENLDRETYRNAVKGALQLFLKGPTIPSIEKLVESLTQISPNIEESFFQEWVLGRDSLYRGELLFEANTNSELPIYSIGKFGNGLLLNKAGQTATLPTASHISFREGTWEAFVSPHWRGIDNDGYLTFDLDFDGLTNTNKIFIGSTNQHPDEIPFTLSRFSPEVLGKPSNLHRSTGYFIWFDSNANKWRVRMRAPITESRVFSGNITTTGEFYNVVVASTADGYDGYDGEAINEINDSLRSSNETIKFSFVVDAYDSMNMAFDAYDAYNGGLAGFDGFDFTSDNVHYLYDTGITETKCRMSLLKDGKGFLRFKVWDKNNRLKMLSANVQDWEYGVVHHVATSWRIDSIEMRDELHLFIDGVEQPNTYRFGGYLPIASGTVYMDDGIELLSSSSSAIVGGFDLSTVSGSNIVTSIGSNFTTIPVGSRFLILDETTDGLLTQVSPYVFVKSVIGQNQLELEVGPVGSAVPFNLTSTLQNVRFSVNFQELITNTNPSIEDIRIFRVDSNNNETELRSPNTTTPQYDFTVDGYQDYVRVLDGVPDGYDIILKSYGLNTSRIRQQVYMWPDQQTNILKTITPAPTSVSKVKITTIITKRTVIEIGTFALVATSVGGHFVPVLASNLDFCQPSNNITGKRLEVTLSGSNIDYSSVNRIIVVGDTTDGYGLEQFDFTQGGSQISSRYFTSINDIGAVFTPIDTSKAAGIAEIREAIPLNIQENDGLYADVHLSVQEQAGINGVATISTGQFSDAYARFGENDIGKTINITSPSYIAGSYTITDVSLDPSSTVKDSNTLTLNTTWADGYTDIHWNQITTSYGDSGFANGLITLETAMTGGSPFLLHNCWYEVDFPAYLTVPWDLSPETLYIGSDINGQHQASAVIDEMRILNQLSNDTRLGESAPSSGRSITTDAQVVKEYTATTQTLSLFHFNDNTTNSADFLRNYEEVIRQSENSVNSNFGQSAVFDRKKSLAVDNQAVFQNNEGTIEFWVSPILDTYNDPTVRYYVDLSPEQQLDTESESALIIVLPTRARSITSVTIANETTNFFTGGTLATDGRTIRLGQPLPSATRNVTVTYVPITSQGDRFSILKDETGALVLSVRASDVDYQIRTPIYWKKNTWHRVFVGWDLNNSDNQDRLILIADGSEGGIVRYGTGLLYGSGVLYGQPTIWGSATAGTTASRNILADINLTDLFNTVHIGADFTGQFPALARMDNIRFSSALRPITLLGGSGPGQLLGRDALFTSNTNAALPVISDALTRLLLDFDTNQAEITNLAVVRNEASGIFDFNVEVIDTFELVDTTLAHSLITKLINRIKPGHTRAFVDYTK